ncbi:MAG: PDZ domain-containing protein [Proteobacteria bacterium]|nr:PDZ domain-containing protein [Pseudomonadota bacterium]
MKFIVKRLPFGVAALLAVVALAALPRPAVAESGFSGMHVQGMSLKTAKALGRKTADGVLVSDIALGGPADQAGIKRGDLIVEYAGQKIDTFKRLVKVAGSTRPGQEVKVLLIRHGKPMTLTLKLGARTEPWKIAKGSVVGHPQTGLTMASLTQKLRKGFGLRWSSIGVLVTLADPERKDIGLRRGDLITQVNQDDVWKPEQVVAKYKAAKKAGKKELLLLVERVNGFYFMLLPVR